MAATIPVIQLTNIATTNSPGNWSPTPGQRMSILFNAGNPTFPRNIILDTSGILVSRPFQESVQIPISVLIAAAATANPNLTFPPLDVLDPANVTVNNLGNFSLTSNFYSEISETYQWQLSLNAGSNWANISANAVYNNVTTNALTVNNANGLSGDYFRVIAMNPAGSTNSNAAIVTTVPDPTIILQPVTQTITHPAACSFTIAALGLSSFSYQWQANNGAGFSNLSSNALYSGATSNSLYINTVTGLNNYTYRCYAADTAGNTTSNIATLTVL